MRFLFNVLSISIHATKAWRMFADDDFERETLNKFGIGELQCKKRTHIVTFRDVLVFMGLRAPLCLGAENTTEICLLSSFVDSSQ